MTTPKAKLVANLKSLARMHTDMCIKQLCGIAMHGESESARVQAIGMLLDRGWGKPDQPHSQIDGDIRITIRNIVEGPDIKTIEHK